MEATSRDPHSETVPYRQVANRNSRLNDQRFAEANTDRPGLDTLVNERRRAPTDLRRYRRACARKLSQNPSDFISSQNSQNRMAVEALTIKVVVVDCARTALVNSHEFLIAVTWAADQGRVRGS
jgi:hypothetical protein